MNLSRALLSAVSLLAAVTILVACTVSVDPSPDPDPDPDPRDPATTLEVDAPAVGFPGTSSATIQVEADGAWTADTVVDTAVDWLTLSRTSGDGNATLTLTVDRSELAPGEYGALVVLSSDGADSDVVVVVAMRFPRVHGSVVYPDEVVPFGALDADGFGALGDGPVGDEVEGEWIVTLDRGLTAAAARGPGLLDLDARPLEIAEIRGTGLALAERHGLGDVRVLGSGTPVVRVRAAGSPEGIVRGLRADPRVVDVAPNRRLEFLQLASEPNDPLYPQQWHYPAIDLPEAWEVTTGSDDVIVAVIDGGFAMTHEDLAAKWVAGMDFADEDLGEDNTPDATGTGCAAHGTHVAGTVGAITDNGVGVAGVAPESRLLPVQIGAPSGTDDCALKTDALVLALKYVLGEQVDEEVPPLAADQRPRVVNLSIGGRGPLGGAIEDLLEELHAEGVVVVAAAGNDAGSSVMYPAIYASTIAVGATDHEGSLAHYSAFGTGLDVLAPGGEGRGTAANEVISTFPRPTDSGDDRYGPSAGTSMAAPHVAGVAALLLAVDASLGAEDVRGALHRSADGYDDGWTPERGYGLISARVALDALGDPRHADTVAQLFPGGTGPMIEEVQVDAAGTFRFTTYLEAGDYFVSAFNEDTGHDGFADAVVDYVDGDADVVVEMEP